MLMIGLFEDEALLHDGLNVRIDADENISW
jgi:hypothetical protein